MARVKHEKALKHKNGAEKGDKPADAAGAVAKQPRKRKRMWRSAYVREIKRYQRATHNLVPRSPVHRLIRELTQNVVAGDKRWSKEALERLHVEAEAFMTQLLQRANNYTVNAKRCTVRPCDIQAANNDMECELLRLRAAVASAK